MLLHKKTLVPKLFDSKIYKHEASLWRAMKRTTLTLSEPVAKTLKVYTVQSKSSLRAQSQVVEEALIEFFEKHKVKSEM
jgi:hypothetical protein